MTSNRPYLLRALNEWILDNSLTPHLLVDAAAAEAVVPKDLAVDGKIVFNISPEAIRQLDIASDAVRFQARFGGRPFAVSVPVQAVLAIYAKENGKGMAFPNEEPADGGGKPPPVLKPTLKVVK